jgi:hypothetical protein
MKTLKVLAISALCTALAASAALAGANCTKSGATAAGTGAGGSAATVHAASAGDGAGCGAKATNASVTTAGTGCAKSAAMAASGAGCHSAKAAKVAAADIDMETVKMPSGVMAVLYTGKTPEAKAYLADAAKAGCASSFACPITREMASSEHCKVEIGVTSAGVMVLVKADNDQVRDEFAKKFEVAMTEAQTAEKSE